MQFFLQISFPSVLCSPSFSVASQCPLCGFFGNALFSTCRVQVSSTVFLADLAQTPAQFSSTDRLLLPASVCWQSSVSTVNKSLEPDNCSLSCIAGLGCISYIETTYLYFNCLSNYICFLQFIHSPQFWPSFSQISLNAKTFKFQQTESRARLLTYTGFTPSHFYSLFSKDYLKQIFYRAQHICNHTHTFEAKKERHLNYYMYHM